MPKDQNNKTNMFCRFILLFSMFFLTSCNLSYQENPSESLKIEVSNQRVLLENLDLSHISQLTFSDFINGEMVEFKELDKSTLFKITRNQMTQELMTLMVMPHYIDEVVYFDGELKNKVTIRRNVFEQNRQYSPNIYAINLEHHNSTSYVLIKNKIPKKIKFLIQNRNQVKTYDQKLIITFTSVYSIILSLIFVNLVFYFYIRKVSYFYYALYIFSTLFALFFQEGWIAYFDTLSKPVFGTYTEVIWIKLPSVFFWFFTIKFLDLKLKSKFDYRLARAMLYFEIAMVIFLFFLSVFNITGIYPKIAGIINILTVLAIFVALYIPIKYALLKVHQAIYLAAGWSVYLLTVLLRIYYSVSMDPMAFWMPRAFEFGLMLEATILSFGLADKTMRIMRQRDVAENKFQRIDRELFCREINNSFQQRANETIEKYYGSQSQLNKIIDWYFISSIQQLVEVKDVFYAYEYNDKVGIKYISESEVEFDVMEYINNNRDFLNQVCLDAKAVFHKYQYNDNDVLRLVIIPIEKKKHDNMCLFFTLPNYIDVTEELLEDLYVFANTITHSLLMVRKFQKSIESSRFDSLTRVLNRKTMDIRLNSLIKSARINGNVIAVAFIDIDDFKRINDKYGHDVGDACLVFLCKKLKLEFKEKAFVGRYGGDEFIVAFNGYDRDAIENKITELFEYFEENLVREIYLKVSIGIAIANKNSDLLNDSKLIRAADRALYKSKEQGKNRFTFN